MAEAAQMSYDVYLKCLGRLAEKRGWLLMSGTFEGSLGWYAETFTEWLNADNLHGGKSFSIPSWSNKHIYPGGRNDPEILKLEALYAPIEGLFDERLGAVPIPPSTLVFRDFRQLVHVQKDIKYNPKLPVYLAVDPSTGGDPYVVLACQFEEYPFEQIEDLDYCNVVDRIYVRNRIAEQVIDVCKTKSWWKRVEGGAIDVESPDDRKRWALYGNVRLVGKKVDQFEGIRRMKTFLHYKRNELGLIDIPPHLRISPQVPELPYEYSNYKRKAADAKLNPTPGAVVEKPPQNQEDHAIKALWYLLIARYGVVRATAIGVANRWRKTNQELSVLELIRERQGSSQTSSKSNRTIPNVTRRRRISRRSSTVTTGEQ